MRITVFYIFLLAITLIIDLALGYKNYSLDNPEVCSPNTKKRLKLNTDSKSAILLTQKYLSDHVLEWKHDSLCKFEVKIDSRQQKGGIFAVIQHIVFRKNEDTGECVDYVQFKLRDGLISKKYCGNSNAALAMDPLFSNHAANDKFFNSETENAFIDPYGELDVYVFVAKEPLTQHEETDITIVFTAYKSCGFASSRDKPCDENHHNNVCIHRDFINDGLYNCPYINCVDESGCLPHGNDPSVKKESVGNKVLIGSVASLFLTFAIFICCIYMCRKYGKLCWAEEFAGPSTTTQVSQAPSSRVIQMTNAPSEHPTADVQAAPSAPTPPEDKDLPPSYESLFPSTR